MDVQYLLTLAAQFLITGVSVVIVAALLPGMKVQRFSSALWFAVTVAFLGVLCNRVLHQAHLPGGPVTITGVGFVLNGLIFLVAKRFVQGVEISGCVVASIAALLVALVNSVLFDALASFVR